jgi:hypothetical protein
MSVTISPERLAAYERCVEALRLRTCTCQYNVPYADGHVKREVVEECERCKAINALNQTP